MPSLSEGAKGVQNSETKKCYFSKVLRESSSQEDAETAVAGSLRGLDSQGSAALPVGAPPSPQLCAPVLQAYPSSACAELTLVLRLFAFFCQISSPSFWWLSSRATDANMLSAVRSGPRHALPEAEGIREKTWKGAPPTSSSSCRSEDGNAVGLYSTDLCLPTRDLNERNKCNTLTYVQKYNPFMREKKEEKN